MALTKIYSVEPFMHDGDAVMPGDSVDVDPDAAAAILSAGRGTLDAAAAKATAKQYAAAQASAAAV